MSGVRVDPRARVAWVEAAAPHGLAPLSGGFPGVGAVSYTLGGGVGLLARRYGFAADHVRRFDLVTLDARLRRVTADSDPDLFWALRGGGGNFGVVTGMEVDLFPVARVYGGNLSFDVGLVPGVLEAWRGWTGTVPEEMTSAVTILTYPDLPMLPEPCADATSPRSRSATPARGRRGAGWWNRCAPSGPSWGTRSASCPTPTRVRCSTSPPSPTPTGRGTCW
ncbi:hypothetical protein GCM10010182_73320 [Actinomadura cremea]|nr:hypothetical protein GCM10010182_73320 [Actinomadura cremea]